MKGLQLKMRQKKSPFLSLKRRREEIMHETKVIKEKRERKRNKRIMGH
jgi:hypothetical protein